ncbi:MAG TPA: transcription elongation factor GreA [Patescibacteria group bacterium]
MTDQKHYLTKARFEELQGELEALITVKRKEIAERIAEAIEMGDLSENAAYTEAKDEQAFLEGRILELTDIINNANIINGNHVSGRVEVGSKVVVDCDDLGKKEYTIVGATEADPLQGFISNESPLGEAFLGRKENDEFEINIPKGVTRCKIIRIE